MLAPDLVLHRQHQQEYQEHHRVSGDFVSAQKQHIIKLEIRIWGAEKAVVEQWNQVHLQSKII